MIEAKDFEELLKRICKETGKSAQEVKKLIDEKKTKFSGLLTDSGAAFMTAKELGIKIDFEKHIEKKTKINNLEEDMKNLELPVRVLHVYSPRAYEKNKKTGRYCRLLVGDETGEISLTLWGENVKKIEKEKVERGTVLLLKNAYVSSYKGKLQLGLRFNSELIINPSIDSSTLPKPESIALKIADLDEGMENVDIFARVMRVFELNEFMRDGEKRKVVNFLIGDDSGQIRATAWNNLATIANKLEAGELIKIEGAYTKKGLKGLELHLGWNSRILLEPVIGFKIPELEELTKTEFKRAFIPELVEGEHAEILGTVIGMNKGKLLFNVCPKCGSKLLAEGDDFICSKCGEIKKPKKRLVITITVDDGFEAIRASVFGRNAEKVLDKSTAEIARMLEAKDPSEAIVELSKNIIGKSLLFSGTVKRHSLNPEELELSVSIVRSADIHKEAEKVLERIEKV